LHATAYIYDDKTAEENHVTSISFSAQQNVMSEDDIVRKASSFSYKPSKMDGNWNEEYL
jgi:hypothetical protein